ncbi:MAG: metal-dependent phosphohydrolase [Leptolyngbyaceae cyanobacterium MAG.088]|nr:metal-dependent phosphohydrolase [Leptolyngbyaceae cyanobacterium MAG.088]
MYSPKQTLIDTFIAYLQSTYQSVFGGGRPSYGDFLGVIASKTLETIAKSDALYHDLEHTILVATVGQEILQAKRVCDGLASVTSEDWLNFIAALLCHDIGYCRGVCRQDDCDLGRHYTGIDGEFIFLPFGATDAALSRYHVDRSLCFVQEQFQDEPLIDIATVQHIIDRTRFPISDGERVSTIQELADLGRSADLIGQFSDRNYLQKLPALFYEFEQNGTNDSFGYRQIKDVRLGLTEFYWNSVHIYVKDALSYLNHTSTGQQIVMELHANLSTDQPRLCA